MKGRSKTVSSNLLVAPQFEADITGKIFERLYAYALKQNDRFKELTRIPGDAVEVETVALPQRTVEPEVPKSLLDTSTEPFVRDCLAAVVEPARVVKLKYREYGSGKLSSPARPELTALEFHEGQTGEGVEVKVSKELLEPFDPKTSAKEELKARQTQRLNPFVITGVEGLDDTATDTRRPPALESERPPLRVSFEARGLDFAEAQAVGAPEGLEPLFCSLVLVDVATGARVSETFHFDLNSDGMLARAGGRPGPGTPLTKARRALFDVVQKSTTLYALVRVEKVLRPASVDACVEPYTKLGSLKPKAQDKLRGEMAEGLDRLGQWTQGLLWTAWPVFRENGQLTFGPNSAVTTFARSKGDMSDEVLFEKLARFSNEKELKKMKLVQARLSFTMSEVAPDVSMAGLFTPSLKAVVPKGDTITREMQDFGEHEVRAAFTHYSNLMYVYPKALNFSHVAKSKGTVAISVKLMDSDADIAAPGLEAIYGRSNNPTLMREAFCSVSYKNKKPTFFDEVKLQLPPVLTDNHHVVFTFYELATAGLKKKKAGKEAANEQIATPVGYAFVPVVLQRRIQKDGEQMLKVAETLPPRYVAACAGDSGGDIEWLWDGRPIFTVGLRIVSTVYSQDGNLNDFLHIYRSPMDAQQTMFLKKISWLKKVPRPQIIRNHIVILNALFVLMATRNPTAGLEAMNSAAYVLDQVASVPVRGRHTFHPLLQSYLNYRFRNFDAEQPVHVGVVRLLQLAMVDVASFVASAEAAAAAGVGGGNGSGGGDVESRLSQFKHIWFYFTAIVKSMTLEAWDKGLYKNDENRSGRTDELADSLRELVWQVLSLVRLTVEQYYDVSRGMFVALAFFVKDLYMVADRGFVHDVVRYVSDHVAKAGDPDGAGTRLRTFKFTFLRIVCDHEHYIQFNLPIPDRFKSNDALLERLWKKHFLVGLVVRDTVGEWQFRETRPLAIATLRSLLAQHDSDPRYGHAEARARIAMLYFPLLLRMMRNYGQMDLFRGGSADHDPTAPGAAEKRTLLLCVVHVLKNLSVQAMADWWGVAPESEKRSFFKMLQEALSVFEFDPQVARADRARAKGQPRADEAANAAAQDASLKKRGRKAKGGRSETVSDVRTPLGSPGSAAGTPPGRGRRGTTNASLRDAPSDDVSSPDLSASPSELLESVLSSATLMGDSLRQSVSTLTIPDADIPSPGRSGPKLSDEERDIRDSWLSHEVSLVVLDLLMAFMYEHSSDLASENSVWALDVYVTLNKLLGRCQSAHFLKTMLQSLRTVLNLFPDMFFSFGSTYFITQGGELTFQILRLIDHVNADVRSRALAILYIMIRRNFAERKNLGRMKLQMTVAAERVLSGGQVADVRVFKRALTALREEVKRSSQKDFVREVEELVGRLLTAAENSAKMNRYRHDPETLADLYFRTSQSYLDSPDLRVTWLLNLANLQLRNGCNEEAAMCKVHIAALVCGYNELLKRPDAIPIDKSAFRRAAPNIDDVLARPSLDAEEGVCSLPQFLRKGLFEELNSAIELLRKDALYETCIEVYRILTSVHQKNREYSRLTDCYEDLHGLCNQIVASNEGNSRLFSKFYRVKMIGKNFAELDGCDMIYKEPASVRLGDIQDRLVKQYQARFGDIVVTLPNKEVDPATLDKDKMYFQFVECQEYLEPEEAARRATQFERIWNINRFIYEQPFAVPGKKIGEVADTCKRKTILTSDGAFPYVTKRMRVVKTDIVELSPIQASIELIQSRIAALRAEVAASITNTRTLQIVLQGSVLLQVNAGPLEICRVFLGDDRDSFPADEIATLSVAMKDFVDASHEALLLNAKVIGPDQLDFQHALEEGYKDSRKKIYSYADPEALRAEEEALKSGRSLSSPSVAAPSGPLDISAGDQLEPAPTLPARPSPRAK